MDNNIDIIEYDKKYHADFKRMNLDYLNKYNLTESHDMIILDNPEEIVIKSGGFIWLAKAGDEIVGTVGIMPEGHGIFELIKMCVAESWRGRGISKLLMETCLQKVKDLGGEKLFLFSNHQLQTALKLYTKYGFKNVEVTDSPFETADVKMELEF
ncbi:MAG TPA: GNAT family N-acetyltransferase [Chitinophagaceae bacterium]|nr:GNAT family N-acetyltransferase [Chitinophagaceae bacterium]